MEKETILTTRQEKLLKTVIVKNITDKVQEYLNDKEVVKMFPMIADITEKIVMEFNETNLVEKANEEIRKDIDKETFPDKCTDCGE
jgi:hypothetical protein